jgi:hypothetical protein
MAVGFFGGIGFTIKIYENSFVSSYYEYTDDVRPYKVNLNDTAFYSSVTVDNRCQSLILDKEPSHKQGEQITGYLTYTTKEYYERKNVDRLDTIYVSGKIYFTCNTK